MRDKIERYDPSGKWIDNLEKWVPEVMHESKDGGWVKYEDYETIKKALDLAATTTVGMAIKIKDAMHHIKELEAVVEADANLTKAQKELNEAWEGSARWDKAHMTVLKAEIKKDKALKEAGR